MLKIGIVGSESSHASAFAHLANFPEADGSYPFGEVRVTGLYGDDAEKTARVAREERIPCIAEKPEDLLGRVDAVMVVSRDGGAHARYALPFLRAGIPVWVDKPLTLRYSDALLLAGEAGRSGTLLTGGSTVRFSGDVLALSRSFARMRAEGTALSAAFNFPADLHSEYGGVCFYGSHAAEILVAVFGGDVCSVKTDVHCGRLVALVKYPEFTVTINFVDVPQYYGILYAATGVVVRSIDLSGIYRKGFADFLSRLKKGGASEAPERLLLPVRFLNALELSIRRGGAEVNVSSI